MHTGPTMPKRGFYADPTLPDLERWWDGTRWTTTTRPARAARGPLWPSQKVLIWVMALGLALAVVGAVPVLRSVFDSVGAPVHTTPGRIVLDLDAGHYTLFEATGTSTRTGPVTFTRDDAPVLQPDDVTVTAQGGVTIPVTQRSITETITAGDRIYTGFATFEARRAGQYLIEVAGPPSEVMVTRSLFDGLARPLLVGGLGLAVGGIAATSLAVVAIVKGGRRRRGTLVG
jgi:hypothetical protein